MANNLSQLYSKYNSSSAGLSTNQAQINAKYGYNGLAKHKRDSFAKKFLLQFKNLMIIVLLASAVVSTIISLVTKEYDQLFEGALVFAIVVINALIGVIQENKAEVALEALEKQASPKSRVLRDGKVTVLASDELVVGDVVLLKEGDFVPADITLIEASSLKCDESSLTGESVATLKDPNFTSGKDTPLAEQADRCFKGTSVCYGSGKGIITAVGNNTQMGKIAGQLIQKSTEKTPLEKNISRIGKVITWGVLIIVTVVFFVQNLLNHFNGMFDSFLTAIALAVAAIPESLPAVITIIMALGVQRLAKQNAIAKQLASVETLGCVNVLCTDKTGTLTQNKMSVRTIYADSRYMTGNFGGDAYTALMRAAVFCNNAKPSAQGFSGDATETSLMMFASERMASLLTNQPKRISEIPFDSSRKIMSVVVSEPEGETMYSKGAYDFLLPHCGYIYTGGKVLRLDDKQKQLLQEAHNKLARSGQRVIAVAKKKATNGAEDNLILLGLVGIIDPPRPQVYSAIKKCQAAGLKPVMITGDHPDTALAIAKELSIAKNKDEVITGVDLDTISDKHLHKVINNYSVFARVTPEHKTRIVKALKKAGNIVGFTGDGINDAPSIKAADIGLCMGSGKDVTKSVSDLIISDDDYSTIVMAIEQGRTIFNNIQKTLLFLLSTNMVEVLGIFVAALIFPSSVFLLPSQILFINLVTDSLPAFALGLEAPEPDIMQRPPRSANSTIFNHIGWQILWQGFIQTFAVMIMFVVSINLWGNTIASTMVFITICLMQIIHAINCKTLRSITKVKLLANRTFNISFVVLLVLILAISLIPPIAGMFGLASLNFMQWAIITLTSLAIIPLVEICKYFANHKVSLKLPKLNLAKKQSLTKQKSKA